MTFDSRHIPDHRYFVTANICGWQPLFLKSGYAEIILSSLAWLRRKKRMALYAFVLMPTHLHAIVLPLDRSIGELLQNFGSYTAHVILHKLREENQQELLAFFHSHRRDSRQEHSVWQDIQVKIFILQNFLAT